MKFCMKCGAFYEEKGAKGCPRCAETARLHAEAEEAEVNHAMRKQRGVRAGVRGSSCALAFRHSLAPFTSLFTSSGHSGEHKKGCHWRAAPVPLPTNDKKERQRTLCNSGRFLSCQNS